MFTNPSSPYDVMPNNSTLSDIMQLECIVNLLYSQNSQNWLNFNCEQFQIVINVVILLYTFAEFVYLIA